MFQRGTMTCKIEFSECLKDSPKFRLRLEQEESEIDHLDQKLEKIIKMCSLAVDSGKEYIRNQSAFATTLWDLQKHFHDDKSSTNALAKLIHCLQEMNKFHTTLLDQANRTVLKNLTSFLKKDVKEVKDYKQIFTKVSENMDAAVYKNSQVNKNRPADIVEAENLLSATKSCFNHAALDYVNYITMLQNRKRYEILSTLLSYIQACSTYYHQGSDLCEDFGSFFKSLDEEIGNMRSEYNLLDKQMQNRHTCVNELQDDGEKSLSSSMGTPSLVSNASSAAGDDPGSSAAGQRASQPYTNRPLNHMEGYLFKRTSNAFKTWNRRWFCMRDNQLFYRKRTGEELPTVMEEDLRLCTVRLLSDSDRRFCFEVISPTKSHILQADSEAMLNAWFKALQKGIDSAIQFHSPYSNDMRGIQSISPTNEGAPGTSKGDGLTGGPKKPVKKINWTQMLRIPGNSRCCDCGNTDPKWASINLGITLCIACSGVHRSLGVHYSKVRSLTLDVWEPEILRVMIELGNDVINRVYEANTAQVNRFDRATDNCEISIREAWIRAKYIERKFVLPLDSSSALGLDPTPTSTSSSTLSFKSLDNDSSKYPEKWSIKKLRRRSYRNLLRKKKNNEERVEGEGPSSDGNTDTDPDADEKDVNLNIPKKFNDILLIGENIIENNHNLTDENLLLLNSDQESTSGEEDNGIMDCEEFDKLNPNFLLYKAASGHNLPVMCQSMALGADKNWRNPDEHDRTALHAAILSGSVMSCEFLLLNGCNINAIDRNGYTALHLATEHSSTAQAYLLLKHKAKYDIAAGDGKLPINIAVDKKDADIVTLLRLAQLNDEIGPGEDGDNYSGGDSTYAAVMNDFSHLTSNQPQRLQRNRYATGNPTDASISSVASSSSTSASTVTNRATPVTDLDIGPEEE